MKKAVRLAFLDFTRIEQRRHFLNRELELNAPHAPGLYRDVIDIEGEPVLRMARVPEADFLDEVAKRGAIDAPLLDALADAIAAMHAAQPPSGTTAGRPDPATRMHEVATGNAIAARDAGIDPAAIDTWRQSITAALTRAGPALNARAPLIRRAHGDLHLGNLLLWHGRPTPFDALEFDEELATIDPGYDLAFLLMDLDLSVGRPAANRVLNRYVARTGDAGLTAGLKPFLSLRAMIRAHVEARRGRPSAALLAAAQAYLAPSRPMLLAIGGLMGTGKSTLARALAPALGPAPGALILRSDEIRKRLHGVAPEDRLPPAAYATQAGARTNQALLDAARSTLQGGHAAILDATFLSPAFARSAAALAQAAGIPFLGIWLHAPLVELERRVQSRQNDASDADIHVLRAAAAHAAPPPGWIPVDALDGPSAQRQVQSCLDLL